MNTPFSYADFAFLKDLELHPGKGIYMEGPLIPQFPAEEQNA
ncbi:MAG: hypothetical protein WCI17_06780 [bacterium]